MQDDGSMSNSSNISTNSSSLNQDTSSTKMNEEDCVWQRQETQQGQVVTVKVKKKFRDLLTTEITEFI